MEHRDLRSGVDFQAARAGEQLVRDYLTTDRRQYEERETSDHWMPHASNPYASEYLAFLEGIGPAAVLAIHTAGDASFKAMGRGYPATFSLG